MKNAFKWIFLLGPILGWLCLVGACFYQSHRVERVMHDADGLVWHHGSQQLIVEVEEKREGEVTSYRVRIREDNRRTFETTWAVDSDMWGGGFVKAIEVDGDSDLEIVMWGRREGGWVLDHQEGRVVKTRFDQVPEPIRKLSEDWYDSRYFGIIPTLAFPVVIIYYLGYGLIRLIIRVRKKKGA